MGIGLMLMVVTLQSSLDNNPVKSAELEFIQMNQAYVYNLTDQAVVPENIEPDDRWIAMDKFWHWALSFTLVGSTYHLTYVRLEQPRSIAVGETLGATLAFGILKEFYDLYTYGLFSYKDLLYDLLGIISGYFVFIYEPGTAVF